MAVMLAEGCRDALAGLSGDLLAIWVVAGIEGIEEAQVAADGHIAGEDAPGVLGSGFHADPGEVLALGIEAQGDGLDEQAARRRHEHGEQRGLEGQQAAAIGGCAFGEDGHGLAGGKRCAELGDLFSHTAALGSGDENGVVEPGQPADEGPVSDLILCDECRAGEAGEDGNVDPADMIGDIEDIVDERAAFAGDAHAEDARCGSEETTRPRRGRCAEKMAGQAGSKDDEQRADAQGEAQGPAGILKDRAPLPHGFCASRVGALRQASAWGGYGLPPAAGGDAPRPHISSRAVPNATPKQRPSQFMGSGA